MLRAIVPKKICEGPGICYFLQKSFSKIQQHIIV